MHEASRGPLKGAVQAQKGSETKTRELPGEAEENSVSRQGVIDLLFRQINDFYLSGPSNI